MALAAANCLAIGFFLALPTPMSYHGIVSLEESLSSMDDSGVEPPALQSALAGTGHGRQ